MIRALLALALVKASTGQKQRANTKRGQLRRPNLSRYYGRKVADLHPGDYEFRVRLIDPEAKGVARAEPLGARVVSIEWNDESDTLSGTASLRRPWRAKPGSTPVQRGSGIRLEVKWGGRWWQLWTLWVQNDPEVDLTTGELTAELGDELFPLKKNERDWEFKKTKKGPKAKGWTCDEIAIYVAKKERIRIGTLAKGTKRFELKKMKNASGLEVIRRAYAHEANATGRKFVTKMRLGKLSVVPFKRPGTLFIIKGIEKEASVAGASKQQRPATVIEAKGRLKGEKGKSSKLEVTVAREKAVRRFGRVVKQKDYGRVESEDDLRTQAKRDLAAELKVTRTATIELPGIPFIEKGSTLRWLIGEAGWHGKTTLAKHARDKSYVFVTGAQHSLTSSLYSTTVQVAQEDVYYEEEKRLDEEAREKKSKERGARKSKSKGSGK